MKWEMIKYILVYLIHTLWALMFFYIVGLAAIERFLFIFNEMETKTWKVFQMQNIHQFSMCICISIFPFLPHTHTHIFFKKIIQISNAILHIYVCVCVCCMWLAFETYYLSTCQLHIWKCKITTTTTATTNCVANFRYIILMLNSLSVKQAMEIFDIRHWSICILLMEFHVMPIALQIDERGREM